MRAFLTGGTGFIGGHVAHALVRRGWDVVALVRSPERAVSLREMGATLVGGDVTEPATLAPMRRCDAVFHLAAWYVIGATDRQRMYRVNVTGTENVLNAAADAGVPRVVHCSSVAALGCGAPGEIRDETAPHPGSFTSIYEETKWHAHRAAHDLAAEGVPVVVAMPGAVYGAGDTSVLALLWRYYAHGWLVAAPAMDGAFSWVHVDDVAEGIVLAYEKGRVGEDYIVGGDNADLRDLFGRLGEKTGIRPPRFRIPNAVLAMSRPLRPIVARVLGQEPRFVEEGLASLRGSWMVSSDKAANELGYRWRAIEDGLPDIIGWYREH